MRSGAGGVLDQESVNDLALAGPVHVQLLVTAAVGQDLVEEATIVRQQLFAERSEEEAVLVVFVGDQLVDIFADRCREGGVPPLPDLLDERLPLGFKVVGH